jgi:hypothetical protein
LAAARRTAVVAKALGVAEISPSGASRVAMMKVRARDCGRNADASTSTAPKK